MTKGSLLLAALLCALATFGQSTTRTVVVTEKEAPGFEINQTALDQTLQILESVFNGSADPASAQSLIFSDSESMQFMNELEQSGFPGLAGNQAEGIATFERWNNASESLLRDYHGKAESLRLIRTRQRTGKTDAIRIVIPIVNLVYDNGAEETLHIMLMEYGSGYKMLGTDH